MNWKIPLFNIYWDDDDVELVRQTIQRGSHWAIGPNIEKFESMLADYIGTKYALVFSSGTSALHSVLLACGIGENDEVIVPSFTFIATANAALFVRAKPIFADIEQKTFGLDPVDVVKRISPRTKAIIPVHYAGCPCMIEELAQIAQEHKLLLIEDAAESLGATVRGRKVGSYGYCAVLSFCANKVITTGEGGAVVTNSDDVYHRLKLIRSHGRADTVNYFDAAENMDYIALGYNFRMSDVTAALGVAQLRKVQKLINMRKLNAELMCSKLANLPQIILPTIPDDYNHVFQMFTIQVKDPESRDHLAAHMASRSIMTKVYFEPVHLTKFYKDSMRYRCELPVTECISKRVITLPLYPGLSRDDINYITSSIAEFYGVL